MKKDKKSLHSVALLFLMVIGAWIISLLIPAGTYTRISLNGRSVVDPDTFTFLATKTINFFDIFLAVPNGLASAMQLVIGALLIGGGMQVVQSSNAINIGISHVIKRVGISRGNTILIFLFYVFALMGGFLGFIEGSIPFIPIAISIAIGLGYDAIVGVAIAMVGAISGFTAGPTNPFTVGVSQTIAGIEMYSGIGLRLVLWVVLTVTCLLYILRYAKKVKADPSKSHVANVDISDLAFKAEDFQTEAFTVTHILTLITLVAGITTYVLGSVNFGWGFYELGAVFVVIGIIAGIINKMGINGTTETFLKGAQNMVAASFIMGVAYGIAWIFKNADVLDTIVYYASSPLKDLPHVFTMIGILIVIMAINLFIPSGSGKALVVMPIVLPIADIVGITPQITVLAYQLGDGLTNLCTPLLGVLLLALGFGRVPFVKWERFILPLVGILILISCATLYIALAIGYC